MTKVALYARVSTQEQNLDDQIERLESWAESQGFEYDLYSEKVSSVTERPEFEELMGRIEEYDMLAVTDLDRFGRSTRDILNKIDELTEKEVAFRCVDQPVLNTTPGEEATPLEEAMRELMSVFASFERKMIRRRLKRGFEKAVEEGEVGRPSKLDDEMEDYVWQKYQQGHSMETVKALVNDKYDVDISKSPVRRVVEERRY